MVAALCVQLSSIQAQSPLDDLQIEKQESQHPFEKCAAQYGQNIKKGPCYKGIAKDASVVYKLVCEGKLEQLKVAFVKAKGIEKSLANQKGANGTTLLHWAAFYGYLDIVEFLVQQDADIDVQDDEGWTPLHYATSADHANVVRYLRQKGADVKALTNEGKMVWGFLASRDVQNALEERK